MPPPAGSLSEKGGEATMVLLGVYCIVTGACVAVAARWSARYRPLFETMGGGLFLMGLGLAGANFILVA